MIDLDLNTTKTKRGATSDLFAAHVNKAIESKHERPRDYLGASAIGDECQRRIQFDLMHAPKAVLSAKGRRIFQRGHVLEQSVQEWLRLAGFDVWRTKPDSYPYGFIAAGGRFRGHVDGVIKGGPAGFGLDYPCIWENKILGSKGWKALEKDGLAKAHPKYADQIAVYQGYLDLTSPALLTAVNADTMDIWYEVIPFDKARSQAASDRAVKILQSTDAGVLFPRIADAPDKFPCPWCDFREHCWSLPR